MLLRRLTQGSSPILVHLHGTGSSSYLNAGFFQSHELVDDMEFIQVMPDAPMTMSSFISDSQLEALIEEVAVEYNVDPRRIYIGGHSQGAMKATAFASGSDLPAAVLPYAGYGGAPDGLTSLFNFHGRYDTIVSPRGGEGIGAAYRAALGCDGAGSPDRYTAGGMAVTEYVATGCAEGTTAQMIWADRGNHLSRWTPEVLAPIFEDVLSTYRPEGCP